MQKQQFWPFLRKQGKKEEKTRPKLVMLFLGRKDTIAQFEAKHCLKDSQKTRPWALGFFVFSGFKGFSLYQPRKIVIIEGLSCWVFLCAMPPVLLGLSGRNSRIIPERPGNTLRAFPGISLESTAGIPQAL